MPAMRSRPLAAVRSVPDFHVPSAARLAPIDRGKISYHEPTSARMRSTFNG
jgi:hypothetical protein